MALVLTLTAVILMSKFNQKRQKGGIGSSAYDPKQKDIRAFFGGAEVETTVVAQEQSESNARDEVGAAM